MKILLICSAGMSTSLVVSRMRKAAAEEGKEYEIWAKSIDEAYEDYDKVDVILIGPQIRYALQEIILQSQKPVEIIDRKLYGLCKGAEILKQAEQLFEKSKGEKAHG